MTRKPPATPEERARAQAMFEQGEPLEVIGDAVGYAPDTVRKWAHRNRWQRPDDFVTATPQRRAAAVAQEANRMRWAHRQAIESEHAGELLIKARIMLDRHLDDGNVLAARHAVIVYGTILDKNMKLGDRIEAAAGAGTIDPAKMDAEELEERMNLILGELFPA